MIRELKLYDLCGENTPEVLKLNIFFNNLFSGLTVYTKNDKPDLIFMNGDKFIMEQDLKYGYLWCRYDGFWSVLHEEYKLEYSEIQAVISYKVIGLVEETFKIGSLTPGCNIRQLRTKVEETFKIGSLTPYIGFSNRSSKVEETFKIGSLTPEPSPSHKYIRK